jgi:hypothetical protein
VKMTSLLKLVGMFYMTPSSHIWHPIWHYAHYWNSPRPLPVLLLQLIHYFSIHSYSLHIQKFWSAVQIVRHFNRKYKTSIDSRAHAILLTFRSPAAESTVRLRLTYHVTFRLYRT